MEGPNDEEFLQRQWWAWKYSELSRDGEMQAAGTFHALSSTKDLVSHIHSFSANLTPRIKKKIKKKK